MSVKWCHCLSGYTVAYWIKFENPTQRKTVYLSNGGHTVESHGTALIYERGEIEYVFRRKNGQEWSVKAGGILPNRWYHVAASWGLSEGLSLYLNGELMERDIAPGIRSPATVADDYSDYDIGRRNDDTSSPGRPTNNRPVEDRFIQVDEFNFWSKYKGPDEIKDLGKS